MYTAKKGGEVLQNGARAIRYRDLQTAVTAAFKYAVKQCRVLSETDPEPDESRRGGRDEEEIVAQGARWPIDNRFGSIGVVNEKTGAVAARITARFYSVDGARITGYRRVQSRYGNMCYQVESKGRFTGVRFTLTTEVLEKGAA